MQFIDLKTQSERIKQPLLARINRIIDNSAFIMGPEVAELEAELARFVGVKHAIGVANGTDALLMALMALGVGPGDEVVTSPFSFFATVGVITRLGAKPVFVDIDPMTYNLDVSLLEAAISDQTKVIMPVSLYGQCADFDEINALAARYHLPVIEDAAQSFGASYAGRRSGGLSTIGCTSFFPSKPLGAYGDAGACFTNDDTLAEGLREIRLHGQSQRYCHTRLGINGRLDTLQAAVLLEKLVLFPEEIALREAVAARYHMLLSDVIRKPVIKVGNHSVYAQYTIEVDARDAVQAALQERSIPTAVHYPIGLHQQPLIKELFPDSGTFPVTERVAARVMSLPMSPYLTEADQLRVVEALHDVLSEQLVIAS